MPDEPDEEFALTLVDDGISIDKKLNWQTAMAVVARPRYTVARLRHG